MNERRKKHLYHIVNPSVRPFICSLSLFFIPNGLIFYFFKCTPLYFSLDLFFIGVLLLILTIKD